MTSLGTKGVDLLLPVLRKEPHENHLLDSSTESSRVHRRGDGTELSKCASVRQFIPVLPFPSDFGTVPSPGSEFSVWTPRHSRDGV